MVFVIEMVAPFKQTDAAKRRQCRQSHDEGWQSEFADSEGVKGADGESKGKRDKNRGPDWKAMREEPGDDDARETDDRTHRQIDACRDDDESLTHGENRDHRALPQEV